MAHCQKRIVSIESLKLPLAAILSCAQAAVRFVKVDRIDLNFFQQVFGNIYLLLAAGYEFEAFASAEEFLERTNLTHHDFIIQDLHRP
jgi:hypothetical protein